MTAALVVAGVLLAACGDDDDGAGGAVQTTVATRQPVVAEMVAGDGTPVGRVTFVEAGAQVAVEAAFTNLPPGFHGFHIHTVGKCDRPAFTTAGGHLVTGDASHPVHAGDQPVLMVLADRTASLRFVTDRYTMSQLLAPEGRAVIVHAAADNYANIPSRYVREPDAATKSTGDAGDRIACGVVTGSRPGPAGVTSTTAAAALTTTTSAGATATTRAGATTTVRAATLDCPSVGFTPNTEDAATSVTATGLSCAEAETFVRAAGARTSSGGPARVDVNGYRCVRVRTVREPIPQAFYECTNGAKKVTFVRT